MSAPSSNHDKGSTRHKPTKPYLSFPLTAHNNGQWCKKIRGKVHFFGVWEDPQAALDYYHHVAADLHAGRKPRLNTVSQGQITVKEVANHFLTYQMGRVDNGEITARWFDDCYATIKHFVKAVGAERVVSDLRLDDFHEYRQELVRGGLTGRRGLGVYALDRSIVVVKAMFDHAYQTDLLDNPVKYGKVFRQSSMASKRKSKSAKQAAHGKRMLEASDIRAILQAASPALRAMILLGVNGGFGSADCASLPIVGVRLDKATIEFPRPKTGVERVVSLWPETIEALKLAMEGRPKPASPEADALAFLTVAGRPWVRQIVHRDSQGAIEKVVRTDAVGEEFSKLLVKLKLKRKGVGFYALRHTFRTWTDALSDVHAVCRIMGHMIAGMAAYYVEEIELPRLRAVAEHVRGKLFGE